MTHLNELKSTQSSLFSTPFSCFTIDLSTLQFSLQASGFMGDSCLPLKPSLSTERIKQVSDSPADVVLTGHEINSNVLCLKLRQETRPRTTLRH